jgi:hypothetical protein
MIARMNNVCYAEGEIIFSFLIAFPKQSTASVASCNYVKNVKNYMKLIKLKFNGIPAPAFILFNCKSAGRGERGGGSRVKRLEFQLKKI